MSVINTNIASLNSQRSLQGSASSLATSLQRLSSGLRINSAKDDAAGLAIASRMSAQVTGLNQAIRNANDGISLAQTAEGALSNTGNLLLRIRDLAVQSANDTNSSTDRAALQQEVSQLQQEINRIATDTEFNGRKLLDGSFIAQLFQVGANSNQTVAVSVTSASGTTIGNNTLVSGGTSTAAPVATPTMPATNSIAAQTLAVSGSIGDANVNVATGDTAKAIADAVNNVSASTGVTATASTTASITVSAAATWTFSLTGAGTAAFSVAVANTNDLSGMADAINGKSATTGITASANGGTLSLTQAQGYDIGIADIAGPVLSNAWFITGGSGIARPVDSQTPGAWDSTRIAGSVSFNSSRAFSVATNTGTTLMAAASNASTLSSVANLSVDTRVGANAAISVVDGALGFINGVRAQLGAVQNRITSAVANLQSTAENLSAARSRIQDADFAQETAALTRSQVLQQAGMAMLAQANALPSQVLSLLRQ